MKSEELAVWYFRLNGFFTIPNFVLHPSRRGSQRTDADIVGIRFPHRAEFPNGAAGSDDEVFTEMAGKPYFVIAEVKRGMCALNGPWTAPQQENVQKILRDLGPFPESEIPEVATALYKYGHYDGSAFYCSLFCVGNELNQELAESFPKVPQRTWDQIIGFLYERFRTYRTIKTDNRQWGEFGRRLWKTFEASHTEGDFATAARDFCGLRA